MYWTRCMIGNDVDYDSLEDVYEKTVFNHTFLTLLLLLLQRNMAEA